MDNVPGNLARTPLLVLAGFLSGGILAGAYGHGRSRAALLAGFGLLGCAVCFALWCVDRNNLTVASICVAAAFFICGTELSLIQNRPPPLHRISRLYDQQIIRAGEPVELTGTLRGQPEPAPQSFYLNLKAERIRIKGIESVAAGTVLLTARVSTDELKNEYQALEL